MSSIKIIAEPPFNLPEDIRRAWVGVIITPLIHISLSPARKNLDQQGETPLTEAHTVSGFVALDCLEKTNPEAASKMRDMLPTYGGMRFQFPVEICELTD